MNWRYWRNQPGNGLKPWRGLPALQLSECRFLLCRRALKCRAPPIQAGGTVAENLGEYGNGCGSFGVRKRREICDE